MIKISGLIFLVFILAGCIAQKAETPPAQGQHQMKPQVSQTGPDLQDGRQINTVDVDIRDGIIEISIAGSRKFDYTSIKQSFPFGIAVYLPETRIAEDFNAGVKENEFVRDVVVTYADKEMTTVKLDILLLKDLDYEVVETDSTLKLVLFQGIKKDQFEETKAPEPVVNAENKEVRESRDQDIAVSIPDRTAILTNIEFNSVEDGESEILVETSHPVTYDVILGGRDKLYLNLYNTTIPSYHKRPLLTQYFKSAVESLIPVEVPGEKKNSKIEIKIRDLVPYRVVQNQNKILLYFEPTRVEPPVFAQAKKTVTGNIQAETIGIQNESEDIKNTPPPAEKTKTLEEEFYGPPKSYSGEKIKLDFYETDLKNVFRILKTVGGLNFAIDKDVQGKVTLSLEDPVPWDQVLDLVLKMNALGRKKEGNVIRIATLETIKKEEQALQEAISERKRLLDQKESLEPLVTEYIPISYSDAEADIRPHIDQILTKERGKISVDKRTNMVIITDVKSKLEQAREIIYRLDKVTPQIMIEAKVVEVTKDFSRELGLGLRFARTTTPHTGPNTDYSVALNFPSAAPANFGAFNFYNILGSDYLNLKAELAASETKGEVKVVSSPRILTLDNKKARIKQGLEYAYLERDDSGGSSVKFKNIDLLLEVTPHVTPDKRISMTVFLTKNDINSITAGVPSLSTNEAETELLVNDNDTIVIGGIVKTTDNQSSLGTPFISGLPVLGRLFRTDNITDNRNELLIFLTPSIVQLDQKRNIYSLSD